MGLKEFPVLFGLETEIGISRDGDPDLDVVAESIDLVRSAVETGVRMKWDYRAEDPHADVRGFRVQELRQDTDEANYFSQDSERELSFAEIKSDLVLPNGARFYNDHAHPEYCTPECSTLEELAAHDRAGDLILMECARRLSERRKSTVRLYKNNTDFRGHSYGCHENYLVPRSIPWGLLAGNIQAFLITRQIFAGAGKFAIEEEDRLIGSEFQISQRSDFFSELQSVDTMQRRPIINTRDEPHADPKVYRRFHVIIGDANMSPFSTVLKVGTTALVLEALARDAKSSCPQILNPLDTLKSISRDPAFKWYLRLDGNKPSTAVDVQRSYLRLVQKLCRLDAPWKIRLIADWEKVLNDLENDSSLCRDRLDWVAKLFLIQDFCSMNEIKPDDPWVQSLDLEYHRLDREEGLFYGLQQSGSMTSAAGDAAGRLAMTQPPSSTRAAVRGMLVRKFSESMLAAQWDHVILSGKSRPIKISLLDLFQPARIQHLCERIESASEPEDLRDLDAI